MRTRTFTAVLAIAMLLPVPVAAAGGHGGPQGSHDYQLNIIGTTDKSPDMTGDNGHRIFVPLEEKANIYLEEADDFAVVDANGTDRDGATFQLPAPGLDAYEVGDPGDADVVSDYSVFIRPLGKPGGTASITTCAELVESGLVDLLNGRELKEVLNRAGDGDAYCSIEQVGTDLLERKAGRSTFTNVTAELLTIVFELEVELEDGTSDTIQIRVPIFDDLLEGEYWEYDNQGLRLAQVRFYDCSTNVETGQSTC